MGHVRREDRRLRPLPVDAGQDRLDPGVREERLDRHVDLARIGQIGVARQIGGLCDLGQEVDPLGLGGRGEVEPLRQPQHHQRHQALAVGRAFEDVVIAEPGRDGCDDLGPLGVEVLRRVEAAERAEFLHDALRYGTVVEGGPALAGDAPQRVGESRHAEQVSFPWHLPARQKLIPRIGIDRHAILMVDPIEGDAGRHPEPLVGDADRRLQKFAERLRAMVGIEPAPGVDAARHRDGMGRGGGGRRGALFGEPLGLRGSRRPARAVQSHRQATTRRIKGEAVAAEPRHGGLDDALHRHGRDGGIHGVAAGFQRLDGGQRGERVGGGRHAVGADGERAVDRG